MNLFEGETALWDYLNPQNHPPTPLVELPASINTFRNAGIRIFAKQLQLLPLLNVKSIPAFNMVKTAFESGEVASGAEFVESSSMSMALCLAVLAKIKGAKSTTAVIDDTTSIDQINALKLFGLELSVHPFVADPKNDSRLTRVQIAKKIAKDRNAYHFGQYSNPANPKAHVFVTAQQIYEQLDGRLTIFSSTLGTTGTFIGSMNYLHSVNKNVKGLGIVRAPGESVPGPRTLALLHDVEFDWRSRVDYLEDGNGKESYAASVELLRHGLIAGPSSGLNLVGIRKFLEKSKTEIDKLRNKDGEVFISMICCDTPFPYLKKYFEVLGDEYFDK